jgi:hypothetical protein
MDNLRRRSLAFIEEPGLPAGTVFNYAYTGSVKSVELPKGRYQLQCWGAQGGSSYPITSSYPSRDGGKGGYSIGVLTLTTLTKLYIFVGGKPVGGTHNEGGWNCGGGGSWQENARNITICPGCGGGATDIALVTSSMSYVSYRNNRSEASLLSRIIVAGGGSGGYAYGGRSSTGSTYSYGGRDGYAGGGTQAEGTLGGTLSSAGSNAEFGKGANGLSYDHSSETDSGSPGFGGAGWYGGGVRKLDKNYASNGYGYYRPERYSASGGGSGFVNTYANRSYRPSGYTGLQLDSGTTYAGTSSFVQPEGGSAVGRSGNGYARITVL